MQLSIITPEKTFFSGDATMVVAPGVEGEFGVLEGHMPFISLLKPGIIQVERAGEPNMRIAVIEGVAEANPEGCNILAQSARMLDGITLADANEEVRTAEAAVQATVGEDQELAARKRLLMAQTIVQGVQA